MQSQIIRILRALHAWAFLGLCLPIALRTGEYLQTSVDPGHSPAEDLWFIALINPFRSMDPTKGFIRLWIAILLVGTLAAQRHRFKWVILVPWMMLLCLVDFHGSLNDVSLGFLGWMTISLAWIHPSDWNLHEKLKRYTPVAWAVFGLSYTSSGYSKWALGPSWRSGNALKFIMENDLFARPIFTLWIAKMPESLLHALTWSSLFIEIAALPLVLWKRTRAVTWFALSFLQLSLALLLDFGVLNWAVLLFHAWVAGCELATNPPHWLQTSRRHSAASP